MLGRGVSTARWAATRLSTPGTGIDQGSVRKTFIDSVGPIWALPATCEAIVIAKAIKSSAHMSTNKHFVYSMATVEISDVLKGNPRSGILVGAQITVAQIGGTIRFPSGHVEMFLDNNNGFMRLDAEYMIFAWKPFKSDKAFT